MAILILIYWGLILSIILGTGYLFITGIANRSIVRIIIGIPSILLPLAWLYFASVSPQPDKAFEKAFLKKAPKGAC